MDKIEELKAHPLLRKPIAQMTKPELAEAFRLHDAAVEAAYQANKHFKSSGDSLTIHNREVSFSDGPVLSHADGKRYSNRKDWDNHLKQHNCFEIGNEYKKEKKREVRGDFNVRKELTQATRRVLGGH